ncbi:hypothetical protein HKD37_17G048724 [Glycine soja]
MQRTKPNDDIFLRQNDDHLPMCTVVETNIGYYTIIHYLNSFVEFRLPIQNPQLYNRYAETLTTVCNFRQIFMLYVQGEVFIKQVKQGSIPHNLQWLQKKPWDGQCH